MSVNIKPLGDYVVAEQEEVQTKTASGFYLPEKSQEKPKTVKVVAVGEDVKKIKVGDRIICKEFSTSNVNLDKTEYVLVKEKDILATVK